MSNEKNGTGDFEANLQRLAEMAVYDDSKKVFADIVRLLLIGAEKEPKVLRMMRAQLREVLEIEGGIEASNQKLLERATEISRMPSAPYFESLLERMIEEANSPNGNLFALRGSIRDLSLSFRVPNSAYAALSTEESAPENNVYTLAQHIIKVMDRLKGDKMKVFGHILQFLLSKAENTPLIKYLSENLDEPLDSNEATASRLTVATIDASRMPQAEAASVNPPPATGSWLQRLLPRNWGRKGGS